MTRCLPVSLSGAVHSSLVLLQMNQCNCKFSEIGDVVVKEFSGLIHAGVETTVANLGNIGMVGRRDEFFQICEPVREQKYSFKVLQIASKRLSSKF